MLLLLLVLLLAVVATADLVVDIRLSLQVVVLQ
jgi:hypothetical protein